MADIDTDAMRAWAKAISRKELPLKTLPYIDVVNMCDEIDRLREVVYGEDYPRLSALEAEMNAYAKAYAEANKRIAKVEALCAALDECGMTLLSTSEVRSALREGPRD